MMRFYIRKTLLLTAALALGAAGCTTQNPVTLDGGTDGASDGAKAEGSEGGPCFPNGSCESGLVCAGGICVKPGNLDLGPLPDLPSVPDGFGKLDPCTQPGQACTSSNPCAIYPVCGKDLLCHPTGVQNCDDGLACTVDSCKGLGLCDNAPKAGSCALVDPSGGTPTIKCFQKGDKKPGEACVVCDPDVDSLSWTGANGGGCDDGNSCTKDDYCVAGSCKGTYYGSQCADNLSCTDDLCDGKGGCLGSMLQSDACLINGVCYTQGAKDPAGSCAQCDVKTSQSAWTPIADACQIAGPGGTSACYAKGDKHPGGSCAECDTASSKSAWTVKSGCLIADTCHKAGDKDLTGCSQCDPTSSTTAWTPMTGLCLIGGTCYNKGDKHSGGCAECDPAVNASNWTVVGSGCFIADTCYASGATDASGCGVCTPASSKTAWSPAAGSTVVTEGFESGAATGWTLTNLDAKVGWQVSKKRPHGGSYALYYGDPATGNYDSKAQNYGSAAMPALTLTAGKKASLRFMLYMDTESGSSYDILEVQVNGTSVWTKGSTTMKTWTLVTVDLSSYAGTKVVVTFKFDTMDDISNTTEGVHLDDVTIFHGC